MPTQVRTLKKVQKVMHRLPETFTSLEMFNVAKKFRLGEATIMKFKGKNFKLKEKGHSRNGGFVWVKIDSMKSKKESTVGDILKENGIDVPKGLVTFADLSNKISELEERLNRRGL